MLFLSVTRIDGELELSLTTRHPHPSMASWAWLFALREQTDIEPLIHRPDQQDGPRDLTVSPSGNDVHIRTRSRLHIVERRRALLMGGGGRVHEVKLASARH